MKNLDLRQFAEVMVALLAQKGIACRLGENNGRIGIIYEEAGIKASTDVTLLWQKYGADYDVAELADVLYKAITSEVQKKKAEMPNPMPEPQVQPQVSRPQMKTQPGRVTQQPMPDDMGGKMQIKCFGQNGAPLFEGSFNSPEEAKAAIAGFMKNVLNADDASVTEFMKEFDARDYNPKQWAKEAKAAGMKYVVLTAKHHDGFCLFDSKYTDYKVTNTPAGRDLIKEYVEALREEGLKVGLYFTLLDWHHPDYPHYGDRIHPMRNHPECSNENRDFSRYIEYMYNQVEEVCTNYGKIDIMWFDFSYDDMRGEKWGAARLIDMVRRLQPGIIIDNRLEVSGEGRGSLYECDPTPYHGDFISPEQIIPPEGICDKEGNPMVWEACFTMNNNWGYCANDHYYKPASMLIKKLVECVSKGGNMILNVGPDAKGKFPKESSAILAEIGRWMDKNHDSIYGCAPAADIPKPDYGRITRNGNKYYVHIYENTLGPLPLIGFDKNKIVKVRALDDGHEVPISTLWVHSDYPDIAFVDLGPDPVLPDPVDYVLEVEMAE